MIRSKTYHTDTDQQHRRTNRQRQYGRKVAVSVVSLVLIAGSVTSTAWARLSRSAGPINGTAPTATGQLLVMFPDGTTAVANNATVSLFQKPTDFLVSASSLKLQDKDGDTGLSTSINTSEVIWTWKYNNVALTQAQLTAPFSTSFLGKSLTVSAKAPVTVSSLTGAPKQNTPATFNSATYTVAVPATLPVVSVNGASFAMNSGFPQTGFKGATFQFWMNGSSASDNSNYRFISDPLAPWVSVDATGTVTLIGEPTSRQTVNISIADGRGGSKATYAFTIGTWFVNNGSNMKNAKEVDSYCAGLGKGYATPSYLKMTNAAINGPGTRAADGRLWDEWGPMGNFSTSNWLSLFYWSSESDGGDNRYYVHLNSGHLRGLTSGTSAFMACSRAL